MDVTVCVLNKFLNLYTTEVSHYYFTVLCYCLFCVFASVQEVLLWGRGLSPDKWPVALY